MSAQYPFPVVPRFLAPIHRVRTLRRWTATLWRWIRRLGGPGLRAVQVGGVQFIIDPLDSVGRKLALWRSYEPDRMCRLYDLSRELDDIVFLDIGANLGVFSFFFALDPRFTEIVSVEPDPYNFAFLSFHHAINGADPRFRLLPVAASDKSGTTRFFCAQGTNRGASCVRERPAPGDKERHPGVDVQVDTVVLDETLHYRDRNLVVKIDVQEHEEAALRGMKDLLRLNHCVVQVEDDSSDNRVDALMTEFGYTRVDALGADRYYLPA